MPAIGAVGKEGVDKHGGFVGDAQELAVQEQFHLVAMGGGDIHGFFGAGRIGPVADDVDVRLLTLHDAGDVEELLGEAHAINLAADAEDLAGLLAAVGI